MASAKTNGFQTPSFILSPHQQDLLFAALNSNRPTQDVQQNDAAKAIAQTSFDNTSPLQAPGSGSLTNLDDSPFVDYDYDFDNDASFGDYDFSNLPQGQMIGNLPGSSSDGDAPAHDKRGHDEDDENDDEPDGKRREGEDKTSKKPGRKPLTSEPTSKRKAQNRAAQRAFRERKEKHLRDLETKVQDLEKASEAANHENLILRSKVEKMTAELKEYKKAAAVSQTPHNPNDVNFSFEFPKFGQLPGPPVLSKPDAQNANKSTSSPGEVPSRSTSFTSNLSPLDSSHNSISFGTNQNLANANSNYSALYNSNVNMSNGTFDYISHHSKSSASGSSADSASGPASTGQNTSHSSPASSNSQHGTSSSCGTSPEPYTQSPPAQKPETAAAGTTLSTIGEESNHESHHDSIDSRSSFCTKLSQVCGSSSNPVPQTMTSPPFGTDSMPSFDINSLDWLAAQNGNQFDPQLFGDYREPQENILTGLYDDSFFNDAFAMPVDFTGNTFSMDATPQSQAAVSPQTTQGAAKKHDLIGEIDAQLEDEVVPAEKEMLTCTNMWEQIQACPAVQNGEIDMDSLCSQLQQKAKCSGEGPVIQETDFKDVLDQMFAPGGFTPCPLTKGA